MKVPGAILIAALGGGGAAADPVFVPVAVPDHVYAGGWEHFVGGGLAALDCDGDRLPDLVAAGGANPVTLLRNGGDLRFARAPFPDIRGATGVYPIHLDADGHLDLVVLRVGANLFLKGDGACGFAADPFDGLPDGGDAWTTAFAATWEPGSDRPTLAFGNYVDRADPEGPFGTCDDNLLVRPDPSGGWTARSLSPGYCALSALISDEDRDGRATLRLSNDRHYYLRDGSEQMWSLAEDRFLGPADGFDAPSIWGMGIASRDITGDGRPDLALTSMGDQLLLLSTPTGHVAAPYEAGATAQRPHVGEDGRPSTGWHAAWGDVDNDGDADLFIAKGNVDQMPGMAMADPNNLLLNEAGTFREVSAAAGVASTHRARGAVLADLDGDGDLDLAVVNRRAPLELWRNAGGPGDAVVVELMQDGPNPRAVGAWVELRSGRTLQIQEVTIGGGHAGGSAVPLHFGIGAAGTADIRVTWPDGRRDAWRPVRAGRSTIRR